MDLTVHTPVLLEEVLHIFDPQPGQTYIDATVNGGGHARAIAERVGDTGRVIGIDWDCDLIREARIRNQESGTENVSLVCGSYVHIRRIAESLGVKKVDGALFDLGFSSYHIERSGRGFSFAKDEPLDMRYNPGENQLTGAQIVNQWPEGALADILSRYGEERFSRRIAHGIARARTARRIVSTAALAEVVARSIPRGGRRRHPHPATRTFQALRIAVNKELESLEQALPAAQALLAPGGTLAVISFHSLEDRIVKMYMRNENKKGAIRILAAKPVRPGRDEIDANPRARSARLRAAVKL